MPPRCHLVSIQVALLLGSLAASAPARGQKAEAKPPLTPQPQALQRQTVVLDEAGQAQAHVEVELVRPFGVDTFLTTVGRVTYADNLVNHVPSPVSGRVRKIWVQPGQVVKKGDALAVVDSPDMGQARADVEKARASVVATRQDLVRQTSLFAAHACSERDLEMAREASRRAQAEDARARKKWTLLGGGALAEGGQLFTLRAPLSGVVLERLVSLGDEVQGLFDAGSSGDLFVLANVDTVWVMADVHESDLGRVVQGARAFIQPDVGMLAHVDQGQGQGQGQGLGAAGLDQAPPGIEGHVEWMGEVLDASARTVKVRCSYNNAAHRLAPNTFVTLRISVPGRDALTVPEKSILSVSGQTFVFVAGGKTSKGTTAYTLRPVEVDEDHEPALVRLPVFHGLLAGEQVVVAGMDHLMRTMLQRQKDSQ